MMPVMLVHCPGHDRRNGAPGLCRGPGDLVGALSRRADPDNAVAKIMSSGAMPADVSESARERGRKGNKNRLMSVSN
jgi:hypothetical protein